MSGYDFDSDDNYATNYGYGSADRSNDYDRDGYEYSSDSSYSFFAAAGNVSSLGGSSQTASAYQFSNYHENYVFNISADNNVLSAATIDSFGRMRTERIDANETYSVVDGYVIKEQVSWYGQIEWSVYADSNGDGRFAEVAEGKGAIDYLSLTQSLDQLGPNVEAQNFKLELGLENKVFAFAPNGTVTAVGEIGRYGQIKNERIDANESYDMVGDFVVKTETSRYGNTEWSVYADGDGDGRWAEIAQGHGPISADLLTQLIPASFATFG